jgi:pimeloyl-ACP methyl ester carboxylesterase
MNWLQNLLRTTTLSGRLVMRSVPWPGKVAGKHGFLDADGARIYYSVRGAGEPVVLIHGYSVSATINWQLPGILAELARHYQVVALDVRGHGRSDKPHDRAQYGVKMVDDVVRLLDHLQIPKVHAIGYSMGGFILLKLMTCQPERLLSATLGGSGGIRASWPLWAWSEKLAELLDGGTPYMKANLELGEMALGRPFTRMEKVLVLSLPDRNDPLAMSAVIRSWRQLVVEEDQLRSVRVPTQLVFGTDEFPGVIDYIRELSDILPCAEVHEIIGTNHFETVLAPDFLKTLTTFLTKQSRTQRA